MSGKHAPKASGILRKTFALNVKRLMEDRYARSPNKPRSLAEEAGVTLSTIQRALSGETAPTLDTVEAIADALRVEPYSLIRTAEKPSNYQHWRTGTTE